MLEISDLSARYGAVTALADVTLSVGRGQIVSLLGSNGAGKFHLAFVAQSPHAFLHVARNHKGLLRLFARVYNLGGNPMLAKIADRTIDAAGCLVVPGLIRPVQRTIVGSRKPPSHNEPLPSRNPPAELKKMASVPPNP